MHGKGIHVWKVPCPIPLYVFVMMHWCVHLQYYCICYCTLMLQNYWARLPRLLVVHNVICGQKSCFCIIYRYRTEDFCLVFYWTIPISNKLCNFWKYYIISSRYSIAWLWCLLFNEDSNLNITNDMDHKEYSKVSNILKLTA